MMIDALFSCVWFPSGLTRPQLGNVFNCCDTVEKNAFFADVLLDICIAFAEWLREDTFPLYPLLFVVLFLPHFSEKAKSFFAFLKKIDLSVFFFHRPSSQIQTCHSDGICSQIGPTHT